MTTYIKLKSGKIGLRAPADVQHGERLRVKRVDGKGYNLERVGRILWRDELVTLCEIDGSPTEVTQ